MTTANPGHSASAHPKPRTIIYVDGFNFYYGAIRGTAFKWLDLQTYFTRLRPSEDIQKIRYFTALVDGNGRARQELYLRALNTLPLVDIVLGKYKYKTIKCGVRACTDTCDKTFKVPEEKRTDVNIAVHMVDDAYQNRCDRLVIVSGDSDLVPGASKVKSVFPHKQIIVYIPTRHPAGSGGGNARLRRQTP